MSAKNDLVCLLLGRLGDIINALPILKREADKLGHPVPFMIEKRYAPLLSGCSYVEPVIWKGDFWHTLQPAIKWAEKRYEKVLCLQTGGSMNGKPWQYERKADSFCLEAYAITGLDRPALPLVFDRRDRAREEILLAEALAQNTDKMRPMLLHNFTGISSPFKGTKGALEQLDKWRTTFNLVDLSKIKAECFYDLLGLYDAAAGLVTIDTATLHLAAASTVPYIAFIQDTKGKWYASIPRGKCVLKLGYSEDWPYEAFHNRIGRMAARKLVTHVYPSHKMSADAARRHALAQYTWQNQGWLETHLTLSGKDGIEDSKVRFCPSIRKLADYAVSENDSDHIVVLTNADTCIADDAMSRVFWKLGEPGVDACYSSRRDFKALRRPLTSAEVKKGAAYPGNDFFAFRIRWWDANREAFPDMVAGAEGWDLCLRTLMEETHPGKRIAFDDLIYHERHESPWEVHRTDGQLASQKHNRALAQAFCKARHMDLKAHGL